MKKMFLFELSVFVWLLFSCDYIDGYGPDCDGYEKGVAAMNIPPLSVSEYNTVKTAFYRLGHWTSCRRFQMPLKEYDTLMVCGYITDSIHISIGRDGAHQVAYKLTDGPVKSESVPFICLIPGSEIGTLDTSTRFQSILAEINSHAGRKIYVRDIFQPNSYNFTEILPFEIIPGTYGDDGPWFSIPMVWVRNVESIRFEK